MTKARPHPTLVRSRHEALLILAVYVLAMTWTGVVCYFWGYNRPPESLTYPLGLGIPDWVFWGIAVPWLACNLFTAWFTLCYMKDEQLADETIAEFSGGKADVR
jgi:hypothetical protein